MSGPQKRPRIRTRGAVGFMDPPSDEEVEVDINATSNTINGELKYDYSTSTSKRTKTAATSIPQTSRNSQLEPGPIPSNFRLNTGSKQPNPKDEEKRKQGASVMMATFEKLIPSLHTSLLSREYDQNLGKSCSCGSTAALYRCRSCAHSPLRCKSCILNDHFLAPWHHIDEWAGTHFARTSLYRLGYRLRLGHGGGCCPNRGEASTVENIVAVHSNGFHMTSIEFCACDALKTSADQLLKVDLFPASFERPETVFTFELLDSFEKLSLKSKINAYDFHLTLQEMTNAAFPQDVPNRYHEFVRVYRVWNHMAQTRRSGQCHSFDDALPHRRKGSVTVRCPACPEVHFNVDQKTVELAAEDEAHKYTLFISADGNFKLQRKNKRGDPDDVSLNSGRGYFVADAPYRIYLSHAGDCQEDCICTHLRAVKFRNVIRFKNAVVSGVIVIQCARHGFYLPQGIADLKLGEA